MILATKFTFTAEKKLEKTCTFTQKWLDHLLLMTLYPVTIETDHHWTRLKMRANEWWMDERTATENIRCWCFSLWEKTQKNLRGRWRWHTHPSSPLYIWGLILFLLFFIFLNKEINKKIGEKNNAIKAWQKENLKITKSQHWVSYTFTLQVFWFSTLYSRPCCIKKDIIIKTRGYNRNYWEPEEVDPTIGCMVLSVH